MKEYVIYRVLANELMLVWLSKNAATALKKRRPVIFFVVGEL